MAGTWFGLPGKPFVTVSPVGGVPPNMGADFGPNTGGTTTSGIQEAIASLPASGGVVFCLKGLYFIKSSLFNTGSYQTVVFAAGAILQFQPPPTGTYISTGVNGPSDILVGTTRSAPPPHPNQNFHDCYWLGDGAQIQGTGYLGVFGSYSGEQVFAAQHVKASTSSPGYNLFVTGFDISNIGNIAFIISANNLTGGVNYAQQVRRIRFSRISAAWNPSVSYGTGASGWAIHGSARQISVAASTLSVVSTASTGPDVSNCFIHANVGDVSQVVVRRTIFRNPNSGSCYELQGNNSLFQPTSRRDASQLSLEGCVFDSGGASNSSGGAGGGYVDDYDTSNPRASTSLGFIKQVVFRRTRMVHVLTRYVTKTPGELSEFKYEDGTQMPGSYPQIGGASFKYRVPGDGGQALPVTGILFTYQNLGGFRVTLLASGGTISAVSVNGTPIGVAGGAFLLDHGETFTASYSSTSRPTVRVLSLS